MRMSSNFCMNYVHYVKKIIQTDSHVYSIRLLCVQKLCAYDLMQWLFPQVLPDEKFKVSVI